jgi:LPS O-antigen subunit length determinant protein (WzzB/FepE family)
LSAKNYIIDSMEHNPNIEAFVHDDDQIDFKELFQVLWKGKWVLIAVTSFFSVAAIIYSLSLPNIYQSRALLSPVDGQGGMNQAMQSYGGLANLAGIDLKTQSGDSNTVKAIQKLSTLSFFEHNILPNIFLPDLMAIESWDPSSNDIVYNKNIYNEVTNTWIREAKYPQTQIPSAQEAFVVFVNENIIISTDIDTGFISLAIKHQSPFVAKAWAELIVKQINDFYRIKDKKEGQAALTFLNAQIAQTSFAEVKQVISQLLQQKMQQLTLIEASDYYVFEYIDPPAVMERKSEPRRSFICILGAFLGGIFSILIVLIRHFAFNKKSLQ